MYFYREMEPSQEPQSTDSPECQRLKKVYFEACEQFGCFHLDQLIDIIEGHSLTGTDLDLRGNLRIFEKSKLKDDDFYAMFLELQTDTSVTSIDLSYNSLSDDVCVCIGKALVKNKTIKKLNLTMCDITVDGCYAISKGLEFNMCLEDIILHSNPFGPDGCTALATMLQLNTTLKYLNIACTDQTSNSLIPICTVLTKNQSIEYLDASRILPYNNVEQVSNHFSQMLTLNQTLTVLKLSKFGMKNSGALSLTWSLRGNTALKHLDVSSNRISIDGARAFAQLLMKNSTLEELCLCSNRIEDAGMIAISEVLAARNQSLKKLWVTNNSISGKGISCLANALHTNVGLTHIYIWGNVLEEAACNAFAILCSGDKPRLQPGNVDVMPYNVDYINHLAESGQNLFSH